MRVNQKFSEVGAKVSDRPRASFFFTLTLVPCNFITTLSANFAYNTSCRVRPIVLPFVTELPVF
jgi:hypothetical protein